MVSRLFFSASDNVNELSPTSAGSHRPSMMTATKVPSASPVHDAVMEGLLLPTSQVAHGDGAGAGVALVSPCQGCALSAVSLPASALALNCCSQQSYASPVAVLSSPLSSRDSAPCTAK